MNPVYELKNKRAALLAEATKARADKNKDVFEAKMAEVAALNDEISQEEKLQAETGRFEDSDKRMEDMHKMLAWQREETRLKNKVDTARSGNDYIRAFAAALRDGVSVKGGRNADTYAPLYAALKETGGTPEGADGGFLVPIDFDYSINEERRALSPLAAVFANENVTTLTGWRVMDTAPATGFTDVEEMANIPMDDQPAFRRLDYKVKKYGLIVPVSSELLDDNASGLMAYLARWFAKKAVITENKLLLALLATLSPSAVTVGGEVKAIKQVLNVQLDPALSSGAVILTNQSGFSAMDELADDNGLPLMQPDIKDMTQHRILGRRVIIVPNRFLPDVSGSAPMYIGDMKLFATLFTRKPFELASTDIGGNAWRTDSVETRGLMRLDARVFEPEAARAITLPLA